MLNTSLNKYRFKNNIKNIKNRMFYKSFCNSTFNCLDLSSILESVLSSILASVLSFFKYLNLISVSKLIGLSLIAIFGLPLSALPLPPLPQSANDTNLNQNINKNNNQVKQVIHGSSTAKEKEKSNCINYKVLTSADRQIISDTRYAFESINLNLSETEINTKLNFVLNKYSSYFKKDPLPNHLQGLVAEFFFRKLVNKTIGLKNPAFRKFTIFIDLILYHKAMKHLGFVSDLEFSIAKKELESEITHYINKQQQIIVKLIKPESRKVIDAILHQKSFNPSFAELSQKFIGFENVKAQMLGSIELIWTQLLNRNQLNRIESMANKAVIDLSINTAFAAIGLSSMIKIALSMTSTAGATTSILASTNSLWSIAFQAGLGCGIGLTVKESVGRVSATYLEMSKALYFSLQNKTSFACELGDIMKNDSQSPAKKIIIPDSKLSTSQTDYFISCASGAIIRLFPQSLGLAIDGLALASMGMVSYNLAQEAYVILNEVPKLYELKNKAKSVSPQSNDLFVLNEKINESEAKIALYLLAMGNNSIMAIRNGFFLYLHKGNISQALTSAKGFLSSQFAKSTLSKDSSLNTLQLVADKLK